MSNDINTLRDALFQTLSDLKSGTMELDRAKAINETAQTIINTAKVEVDFCRTTGQTTPSGFIPAALPSPASPEGTPTATGVKTITQVAGGSVTNHRIR